MSLSLYNICLLLIIAAVISLIARRLKLPYTVGLLVTGLGMAFAHVGPANALTRNLIFNTLLPPLLFEAALNLKWQELKRDALPITVLAIFGVIISAMVTTVGMIKLANWLWQPALVLGVLIAATDPVSVIATFKEIGVKGRLRLLVEAESLFNDGVAAVLYALAVTITTTTIGIHTADVSRLLASSIFGGIAIGALASGLAVLLVWRTNDHLVEMTITAVVAYGSFIQAEQLHVSGVIATVTAGLIMGNMGILREDNKWFTDRGREAVLTVWDFAAFVSNSLIFLLIGARMANIQFHSIGAASLILSIVLVLVGRAVSVYPLSLLFRWSRFAISPVHQHILFWGGLRGALALALALGLPENLPHRDDVMVATFAIVAFSVVVQGITMPWFMKRCGETKE